MQAMMPYAKDSFEFIDFQRRTCAKIASMLSSVVIDTSDKSVQEVHELICHFALEARL